MPIGPKCYQLGLSQIVLLCYLCFHHHVPICGNSFVTDDQKNTHKVEDCQDSIFIQWFLFCIWLQLRVCVWCRSSNTTRGLLPQSHIPRCRNKFILIKSHISGSILAHIGGYQGLCTMEWILAGETIKCVGIEPGFAACRASNPLYNLNSLHYFCCSQLTYTSSSSLTVCIFMLGKCQLFQNHLIWGIIWYPALSSEIYILSSWYLDLSSTYFLLLLI